MERRPIVTNYTYGTNVNDKDTGLNHKGHEKARCLGQRAELLQIKALRRTGVYFFAFKIGVSLCPAWK